MPAKIISRNTSRLTRHRRVRGKIKGTTERPRLNVFSSLRYIYTQIIDDENNRVLVQANSKDLSDKKTGGKVEAAKIIGKLIAEKALKKGIKEVVFDRSGYKYHGKIKALADEARNNGLKF